MANASVYFIFPELFWSDWSYIPDDQTPHCPALSKLLGYGQCQKSAASHFFDYLSQNLKSQSYSPLNLASIRRMGEKDGLDHPRFCYLCADPVQWFFSQDLLVFSDASTLNITPQEASVLVDYLNQNIRKNWQPILQFEYIHPERWYAKLSEPIRTHFPLLSDSIGRPVSYSLAQGEMAEFWQTMSNEIQILLHNHPVNQQRKQQGKPLINSLLLWGNDIQTITQKSCYPSPDHIVTQDTLASGLARNMGIEPLSTLTLPLEGNIYIMDNACQRPIWQNHFQDWRQVIEHFEQRWFAPLMQKLQNQSIQQLVLIVPTSTQTWHFQLQRSGLWKFWRHPIPLNKLKI